MAHEINHDEEPIRLFKSDFMEFFTHISPVVVTIIWLPIIIYFFVKSVTANVPGISLIYIPVAYIVGLFFWTFTEYTLHRFLFHFKPRNPTQERISFLFHGVHHAQPQCKTRLVMPPIVSIPMALIMYGLIYLVMGVIIKAPYWIAPLFSAMLLGYLIYDLTHYATHHLPMRSGYLRYLKRYHMKHHYKTWESRFGVTSPLWDKVFGTFPSN
jgi:sterol desaturase/sphingolipid hydroxylase (fatty acid hydroxylase superfamily)